MPTFSGMNPGAMVAIHAAAAAQKAKTKALDAFRVQGATAPERARSLQNLGLDLTNDELAKLIGAGVVRGVDSRGRLTVLGDSIDRVEGYYLDEAAFIANRDGTDGSGTKTKELVLAIAILLLVAGAIAVAGIIVAAR